MPSHRLRLIARLALCLVVFTFASDCGEENELWLLISSYEDANPLSGSSQYHVYSVDLSGNQSAVATVNLTVTLGHQTADLYQ